MPLGYLKRPSFLLAVAYMLVIAVLHHRGYFEVEIDRNLLRMTYRLVRVEGVVISPLHEDRRGFKVTLRLGRINGKPIDTKAQVFLRRNFPALALRPGQTLALDGTLRRPRPARNPGEFDERGFLQARGIAWIFSAERGEVLPAATAWRYKIPAWAEATRRSLENFFAAHLAGDLAHIMSGVTLGYKGALSRDMNRAAQDAGVIHLLVPSGAKVAFVLLIAGFVCAKLSLGPLLTFMILTVIGGFYTLMVGCEPPYLRAYYGALVFCLCRLFGRDSGSLQALVLSALAILIIEPRDLYSVGFQMTYLALAGLILALPSLHAFLKEKARPLVRLPLETASITFIVQIMLWPIFANVFGRGQISGALANIILVPFSALMMAAGFGSWALSFLIDGQIMRWAVRATTGLAAIFRWTCFKAAALPWAAVDLAPMSTPHLIAYFSFVLSILIVPRMKAAVALFVVGVLAGTYAAVAPIIFAAPREALYFHLREGSAALVTRHGADPVLYLAGGPAGTILKTLKTRRIDKIIVAQDSPTAVRALPRLKKELRAERVEHHAGPLPQLCEGAVCYEFTPPRVTRGNGEFSIIPLRLKKSAVRVATDGKTVTITDDL